MLKLLNLLVLMYFFSPNLAIAQNPNWAAMFRRGLAQRNLDSRSFSADQQITRAELAVILDQAFPFAPLRNPAIAFEDVGNNFWAAAAIQNSYRKGFWRGVTNKFRPQTFLTRQEVMVALAHGLNLPSPPNSQNYLSSLFADANALSPSAIAPVAALTKKNMVVNYPNIQQLNPRRLITKAELSAILYQALVYSGQLPAIGSPYIVNGNLLVPQAAITHLRVNLSRRQVVAYKGNQRFKTYPLGVGKAGWETPVGNYRVKQIIRNPDWKNPFTGDVIRANEANNPLAGFWIGFWTNGKEWSGFHGTHQRDSVGKASSHGCLRMLREDIGAIFDLVTTETLVEIRRS